jgi:hypothetical protein
MKSIDFLNRFTDPKIPALARTLAQRAVRELNEGNEHPLQVNELEFNLLSRYAEIKPNDTHGTLWFRIFDEHDNSKDIQIYNAWKK